MSFWSEELDIYMRENGLTKKQLALKLEVPYATVTKWWHRNPSPDHVARIRVLLQQESPTPTLFGRVNGSLEPKQIGSDGSRLKNGSVKASAPQHDRVNSSVKDTLSSNEAEVLMLQHEIVRDPIHHDIWITALERAIIDTWPFQRLRHLTQLGPTQLVYPGAVHNRFMHCLGTMHCAEELVQTVNRNCDMYAQESLIGVAPYPHLLIRLCALLHDLAHMPFGHTLESEGNLAPGEWKDPQRQDLWLGDDSPSSVGPAIVKFVEDCGYPKSKGLSLVQDIRNYLLPPKDDEKEEYPMNLEYPFVVDIVSNTLCADLLDYLDRDMYFCGLRERSGDRVVKYLALVNAVPKLEGKERIEEFAASPKDSQGKGRLVLLAYRYERQHLPDGSVKHVEKREILSEAIDLLRRRFALAEKVYFHRTKVAASAMLISATASASTAVEKLYSLSDNDLLSALHGDSSERTRHLICAYTARRLYKRLYTLEYRKEQEPDRQSLKLWREMYTKYRNPKWRTEHEEFIETVSGLAPGSVAIYCPAREMNLKQFEMLVQSQPNGSINYLQKILDDNRRREMETINERFEQLWRAQVFVDPDALDVSFVGDPAVQDLSALCEFVMGFPNENPEIQGTGKRAKDQVVDRVVAEWEQSEAMELPQEVHKTLIEVSAEGWPSTGEGAEGIIDYFRRRLRALLT